MHGMLEYYPSGARHGDQAASLDAPAYLRS